MAPFYISRLNTLTARIYADLSRLGNQAWAVVDQFQAGGRPASCLRQLSNIEKELAAVTRNWSRLISAAESCAGCSVVDFMREYSPKYREELRNIYSAFAFFGK